MRPRLLAAIVLAAGAALPFLATLTFGYTYDDVAVIAQDARHHTLHGLWAVWGQSYWGNPAAGLYRPFTQFLITLMWELGGGHALVFRVFVLALHVAATLLVWSLLKRAASQTAALLGALLFAVHPVHVEAIGSIVNATEILVTVLALAMLFIVWRSDDRATAGIDDGASCPVLPWHAAVLASVAYLLALGAKESAGTLPGLVLLGWWGWRAPHELPHELPPESSRAGESFVSTLRRGWRVWVATSIALAIAVLARYAVLGQLSVDMDFVAPSVRNMSAVQRAWTMVAAWPVVAKLLVWPTRLIIHYGTEIVPPRTGVSAAAALSIIALTIALALAAMRARRGDRRPIAALLWIGLAYLPASNLLVPTGQVLAERTLYLSTVGVAMLAAWMVERIGAVLTKHISGRRAQLVIALPVAVVALAGAAESSDAVLPWQSSYTLFVRGIQANPKEARGYWLLGNWYSNEGDQKRALDYLSYARKLDPTDPLIVYYYAQALQKAGLEAMQLGVLHDAVRRGQSARPIRIMFVQQLARQRGADSVIAFFRSVPRDWLNGYWRARLLAPAYADAGQLDSAQAIFRAALAEQPTDGKLHYAFAQALEENHRWSEAEVQLTLAARDPAIPPGTVLWLRVQIELSHGDTASAAGAVAAARATAPRDTAVARLASDFRRLTAGR